jgi:uncharacterized delta-60 repeat protein
MSKRSIFCIAFLLSFLTAASAQPELDISFNATGKVTTHFGVSTSSAAEVLVQSDQKIIAVGATNQGGMVYFALTRYTTNGTLDTSFGDNGRVVTDFDPTAATEGAAAAVLQPDGKIVAAGFAAFINPGPAVFAVVRYNTDGSLDQTFGTGGKASTSIVQHLHHIRAVALAPDGKIVVAGEYFSANQNTQTLIVRFNAEGSLDASFGSGGKVTDTRGFSLGDANIPWSVGVQPDGKIVTGGSFTHSQDSDITLQRYNANGAVDSSSFAGNGRVLIASPGINEVISAIAFQPDGKIVAAGTSGQDFLLMRFTANGLPDTTFDGDGRVTTPIVSSAQANSLAVTPSGKILVSGLSFVAAQGFIVACYNPDGSLDTSFSGDGKVTFGFEGSFVTAAYGMAIDGLGRIVLGGTAADKFAVARLYTAEPTPVTVFGRTITPDGQPIRGIKIGLTNQVGETRWAITSTFGYYQFDDVPTGQTYSLFVWGSKRHTFDTRTFGLNEAIDNLDLIGDPIGGEIENKKEPDRK